MSSNFCLTQNAKLLCQAIHYYHSLLKGAQQAPHCRRYLIHMMLLVYRKLPVGKKKHQVGYPCQLLPRVLQAHYQSPWSRLPEFNMANISVQKASPFTGLQHPLSSE
ncbi:hypothetical protein ACJW31_11G121700 [Castanea mollissima]